MPQGRRHVHATACVISYVQVLDLSQKASMGADGMNRVSKVEMVKFRALLFYFLLEYNPAGIESEFEPNEE